MTEMKGNEYQKLAMRTNDGKARERLLKAIEEASKLYGIDMAQALNASSGIGGEGGEVHDLIKKWIWQEMPMDSNKLALELGDIMWYIAQMCDAFGWELEKIMEMNIDKLTTRYPNGFDRECCINRKDLMDESTRELKAEFGRFDEDWNGDENK